MGSAQLPRRLRDSALGQWWRQQFSQPLAPSGRIPDVISERRHLAGNHRAPFVRPLRVSAHIVADAGLPSDNEQLARLERLLAHALQLALLAKEDGASEKKLIRPVLAEACVIARRRALHPEQVIIMLKGAWARLGDAGQSRRYDAQATLDGAVAVCIQEYFAQPPGHGASSRLVD